MQKRSNSEPDLTRYNSTNYYSSNIEPNQQNKSSRFVQNVHFKDAKLRSSNIRDSIVETSMIDGCVHRNGYASRMNITKSILHGNEIHESRIYDAELRGNTVATSPILINALAVPSDSQCDQNYIFQEMKEGTQFICDQTVPTEDVITKLGLTAHNAFIYNGILRGKIDARNCTIYGAKFLDEPIISSCETSPSPPVQIIEKQVQKLETYEIKVQHCYYAHKESVIDTDDFQYHRGNTEEGNVGTYKSHIKNPCKPSKHFFYNAAKIHCITNEAGTHKNYSNDWILCFENLVVPTSYILLKQTPFSQIKSNTRRHICLGAAESVELFFDGHDWIFTQCPNPSLLRIY